jgi:hypothetical protein
MEKSAIIPRTEYAIRERRVVESQFQRVKILEHICHNKWKAKWPISRQYHYNRLLRSGVRPARSERAGLRRWSESHPACSNSSFAAHLPAGRRRVLSVRHATIRRAPRVLIKTQLSSDVTGVRLFPWSDHQQCPPRIGPRQLRTDQCECPPKVRPLADWPPLQRSATSVPG